MIRQLEESEGYQKIFESMSQGSEGEVERKVQNYLAYIQEVSRLDKEQLDNVEGGVRQAAGARRRGRGTEREQTAEMKQVKKVRFAEEEQSEETRARSTDEQDVMRGLEEMRTGRGKCRSRPRRDERCRTNETSGKGKGEGNGGKGEEHGCKGGSGSRGARPREEDERVQVAPNIGAGGSSPQAMADLEEKEEAEATEEGQQRIEEGRDIQVAERMATR